MTNIMSKIKLSNNPSRNGFDLSRKHCFTASAGQLLPVMVEDVLPGDVFQINLDSFTRTQPLNSAAFARMREYYDLFFVPYHILWSHFPTMITQVPNATVATTATQVNTFNQLPYTTLQQLYRPIHHLWYYYNHTEQAMLKADRYKLLDDGFIPVFESSRKLLDMLGYGATDYQNSDQDTYANAVVSPMRLLAYQKIYADYFRNQQWEDWKPYQSNIDFMPYNNPFGDGNYNYKVDTLFGVENNTPQNSTWNKEHPATMRYANLHKDLFLGVLPESQYGSESVVPLANLDGQTITAPSFHFTGVKGQLNSFEELGPQSSPALDPAYRFTNSGFLNTSVNSSAELTNIKFSEGGLLELSILALRKAEALQKFKEVTQSNDYDYRSQIEAHFGIKPDRGLSHESTWLGGCVNNIGIDSVTNTNISDSSTIIKGKATSAGKNHWTFKSNDYGILMCIYHCEPLLDYPAFLNQNNTLVNPNDFPIPEFDKIGYQTINARFTPQPLLGSTHFKLQDYGYVPRYANFKTAVDYVTGDFLTTEKQWTIPFKLRLYERDGEKASFNIGFSYLTQKCTPDILDSIFTFGTPDKVGEANPQNSQRYNFMSSTPIPDQFLCNTYWDVKVVRNMDRNGLPY